MKIVLLVLGSPLNFYSQTKGNVPVAFISRASLTAANRGTTKWLTAFSTIRF